MFIYIYSFYLSLSVPTYLPSYLPTYLPNYNKKVQVVMYILGQ